MGRALPSSPIYIPIPVVEARSILQEAEPLILPVDAMAVVFNVAPKIVNRVIQCFGVSEFMVADPIVALALQIAQQVIFMFNIVRLTLDLDAQFTDLIVAPVCTRGR